MNFPPTAKMNKIHIIVLLAALFLEPVLSVASVDTTHAEHEGCRAMEIAVSQGQESAKGIPSYRVEITNLCGCVVAKLHLRCGMFASANVVNPNLFKRLSYDDCLVNGGKPIPIGKVISFHYSNTRPYPLSVASFACTP